MLLTLSDVHLALLLCAAALCCCFPLLLSAAALCCCRSLLLLLPVQVPIEHLKTQSADGNPGPTALDALEASLSSAAAGFNDRDVSSTLYGYAQLRLKRQASLSVIRGLVSKAQSLVMKGECSPRCTSMVLWALATLFGSSSGSSSGGSSSSITVAVNGFAWEAARQLGSEAVDFSKLGSQGVANSLWGAVKLGVQPEELLGKAVDWLAANLGRCKMQVWVLTDRRSAIRKLRGGRNSCSGCMQQSVEFMRAGGAGLGFGRAASLSKQYCSANSSCVSPAAP